MKMLLRFESKLSVCNLLPVADRNLITGKEAPSLKWVTVYPKILSTFQREGPVSFLMVRMVGLEPTRREAADSKSAMPT